MGRKNNLNMEELRREVIQDLKLSEKPKNTRDSANSNATNPAHSSFQSDDRNVQDTSNQANGNSSERSKVFMIMYRYNNYPVLY